MWIVANCTGGQTGSIVVEPDVCVEPSFGLSFSTNGSSVTLANNCSESFFLNTIECPVNSGCCYIPHGLSVNVTVTDLPLSRNETRNSRPNSGFGGDPGAFASPLPQPSPGRRFVCTKV